MKTQQLRFAAACTVSAILLGACSTTIPVHAVNAPITSEDTADTAVFAAATDGSVDESLLARNDAALNIRAPESGFDARSWEPAPAPDIWQARWITLPRNPEHILFFGQGRPASGISTRYVR